MNRKIKVLYLVNIPSPYRVNFFNELGKMCDLTVFFERKTSNGREESWFKNDFTNFKPVFLNGIKINKNTAMCFSVLRYLKKQRYDFIIIGGYATPTGMLAINYLKFKKIPFGLNADGGIENKNEIFLKKFLKKYFISSANFWLSTSDTTSNYLKYYGAKQDSLYLYPFTTLSQRDILIDPVENKIKKKLREKLNIHEEKIILSVGQFIYRKGFDLLLKGSKELPKDYGVYILGGKPTQEYLQLKERLDLDNVHFISFKSKEELKEFYMASDLFVLPTREDIWGLVINEAMAYGLPVITTNKCVAGLELVKDNQNGFIVPINNHRILTKRIEELIEDKNLLNKMGRNSLIKIKRYTLENMAKETFEIFENILKKRDAQNVE
jgi:glycosyltransferase involved in cell wall biosynthesis